MAVTSAVFNFGLENGYFNLANPCHGLKRFRQCSRDCFLSKDELKKFFDALSFESQTYQDYFSLILFTGARKSNVLPMKWSDIDFSIKRWRIGENESKNKDVNIVPLTDICLEILKRRKKENNENSPSVFVFSSYGRDGYLNKTKKRLIAFVNEWKLRTLKYKTCAAH